MLSVSLLRLYFIVCLFSFLSDPMHLLQLYCFWAM